MAASSAKRIGTIVLAILLCALAPFQRAKAEKSSIDVANADAGYITVYYVPDANADADFRVGISINGSEQYHPYTSGSRAKVFLPSNAGSLTATLYERVSDNLYKKISTVSFTKKSTRDAFEVLWMSSTTEAPVLYVEQAANEKPGADAGAAGESGSTGGATQGGAQVDISDIPSGSSSMGGGGAAFTVNRVVPAEYQKFLGSSTDVRWSPGDSVSQRAAELVAGKASTEAQVMAIYSFIVTNFQYDWDLANAVRSGRVTTYTPDPNKILPSRKGICYDIASLFAAMTRSAGIPTKLITGNSTPAGGYHAWNSVYDFETLSWVDLDATLNLGGKATSLYKSLGRGYTATGVS